MLCECHCDTCFMGHFGRGIRWKHSFLRLTQFEVNVRSRSGQIGLNLRTQSFHSGACLSCLVLPQDSKNDFCFDVRRLEMPENRISKTSKILSWPYSETLRSDQILFHCETCWWYVIEWYQNHWHSFSSFPLSNFGHISGRFTSVCSGEGSGRREKFQPLSDPRGPF